MLSLRADPWSPERGMGYEAAPDETPATADPFVETSDWSSPIAATAEAGEVWFVDGVRRVELRVIASDEEGQRAFGLFGTSAAGAVRCRDRAVFSEHEVRRWMVLGRGMRRNELVTVRVGSSSIAFEPRAEPGSDVNTPVEGLHASMQMAEANLAARLAGSGDRLVLADGRLGFLAPTASPVVGIVKRFVQAYLDTEQDGLLPRLGPGERTPLFGLVYEGQPLERYAWYTRLVPMRAPWHDHAGLLRCEVRAGVGLDQARAIADRVTAALPRFAGRSSDPRAPQNLAPVAALEAWLQHRMGHRGLIRRAILRWLVEEAG